MKTSIKIFILILLLSATCKITANNIETLPLESWQQAIKHVLDDYRNSDLTKHVSDSVFNRLIDQIIEEHEKNDSDTLTMVVERDENSLHMYIPKKTHITEIRMTTTKNGDIEIKTSNPLQHKLPPLRCIVRPIDIFLFYAENWCLPIPNFLCDLIIDKFHWGQPQAFRIIKSNDQFLIERHELGEI